MAVELKDFIKATLLDIVSAIKETQQEAPIEAIIAPAVSGATDTEPYIRWADGRGYSMVSFVEFDVAVCASSGSSRSDDKSVGIQVIESVLGLSHKTNRHETDSTEDISRIKFSIPLVYPQKVPQLEHLMKNQ